jgi:hypothetical protein
MARSSRGCGPTCRPLRIRITKPWNTRRRFCRAWLSASVSAPGTDTEPEPAGRWWPPHRHRQRPPAPSSFPVGSLAMAGRKETTQQPTVLLSILPAASSPLLPLRLLLIVACCPRGPFPFHHPPPTLCSALACLPACFVFVLATAASACCSSTSCPLHFVLPALFPAPVKRPGVFFSKCGQVVDRLLVD